MKRQNYDLDVMSREMLHMTCAFIGKKIQGKEVKKVKIINNVIKNYTSKLKNIDTKIKFDRFDYLPLGASCKKKLLIALYKNSKPINDWNVELRKELIKHGVCDYDTHIMLHITIGRVKGDNLPNLNKIKIYPDLDIKGIYTCGVAHKYIDDIFLKS
jgi:2'-5' RNA ligase